MTLTARMSLKTTIVTEWLSTENGNLSVTKTTDEFSPVISVKIYNAYVNVKNS
jgi:hypothetical protein